VVFIEKLRAYPEITSVPIAPSNFAPDEGDLTQAILVYGEENRRSMAQNLLASGALVILG